MSAKKAASAKTTSSKKTIPTNKPTTTAGGNASANGKAAKVPATRPIAPRERTLSEIHIGEVAGEIWALLSGSDGETLAAIKKTISASPDLIAAAIGWLAREDKLAFTTSGRSLKIALRK